MKNNILIIGSTGFIGKNLLESFLIDSNNIALLVRDSSKVSVNFRDNIAVKIIETDLKNMTLIKQIIETNSIDIVIHLSSSLIPSSSKDDFENEMNEIILPTYSLLEYLSEKKIKIIFFSSGGTIYGKVQENTINEDNPLRPINYYGYSKLMIENYIQFLNRTKNLSYLILRPSNVYGKYQKIESKQGFISVSIGKVLSGKPIEIWGDGETIRDYINVQDVAILTKKLIDMNINNEIINLGSGIGISLNNIVNLLQKNIDKKFEIEYKNSRSVDVDKMVLDITKLKSYINYEFKNIEDGISEFIGYIRCENEK
ncbi:epimerase [Candidatus Woesearchaeota archaeon]|jgi:UDP-glucose 4-epimerase|nr:MAG: epimerase [Candidatus Woesearchaeota archaeon]